MSGNLKDKLILELQGIRITTESIQTPKGRHAIREITHVRIEERAKTPRSRSKWRIVRDAAACIAIMAFGVWSYIKWENAWASLLLIAAPSIIILDLIMSLFSWSYRSRISVQYVVVLTKKEGDVPLIACGKQEMARQYKDAIELALQR